MHRSKMPAAERAWRSRLAQWVSSREMVRGNLTVRERACGKARCQCTRGHKHVSLYLVQKRGGRTEQLYIPRDCEEQATRWVKQYKEARVLLEKISRLYWERLRRGGGSDSSPAAYIRR